MFYGGRYGAVRPVAQGLVWRSEPVVVMADHEVSLMPSRRVLLTECSGWCIVDESGNAIALNPVSVASTLEAILAGAAS